MKLFWLSLLMLIAVQVPAQQVQSLPPRYACYKTEQPILVDGDIYGKEWANAPWTELFQDIRGKEFPNPKFPTRVKMLWDDQNLYIAAELVEPHIWGTLTERDATIYFDNDFEVFFDPKGDAHNYIEFEINALGTEWDLMMTKPYRKGGTYFNGFDIKNLKTKVKIYGTLNDPSDTDQKWCVEMCVPFKSMQNDPIKPMDIWRMNFSRVEWLKYEVVNGKYQKKKGAESFGNEENWVWAPTGVVDIHMPEHWGFVQFINKPQGNPVKDFVQD